MKYRLTLALFFLPFLLFSQKREEIFDYSFKPVKQGGYYFVITEKKDSLYYREAYFLSQRTKYLDGSYQDEACKIPHGQFKRYHTTGFLSETGYYQNGRKEGPWMRFDEEGALQDSVSYAGGHRIGIGYSWHKNGYLADSTIFDGKGNGVEVSWYDDGQPAAAGRWKQDTLKSGRWKYFERNGKLLATEDYDEAGKLMACNCFDEQGQARDTALCSEKEAKMDIPRWRRFLERNLQPLIEKKAKEGLSGHFTVIVRFIVDKDGKVIEPKALTSYGHGIEEGVVKIFSSAPAWIPGYQFGRAVKSYHSQPVTFVIQ